MTVRQPAHSISDRPEVGLVVIALNEEALLADTVRDLDCALEEAGISHEFVLVDDGSTDGTAAAMETIARQLPTVVGVCRHDRPRGIGAAVMTGAAETQGRWLGWIPGDGQADPADLIHLYKLADAYDYVSGRVDAANRVAAEGSPVGLVLTWGVSALTRLLHPQMPSFRLVSLVRRDMVVPEEVQATTGVGWYELIDRARRRHKGLRVRYEPVGVRGRQQGRSKVRNVRFILRTLADLFRLRLAYTLEDLGLRRP